jgi:SAM-dependent methyltransferase
MKLEPTGERLLVEHYRSTPADRLIYAMHRATYDFAAGFCTGRSVLDYGCGSGWGSQCIAEIAAGVDAIDVAADAIAYAGEHHPHPYLRHRVIDDNAPLPFVDAAFDVVLSFQVIEHVADVDRYLGEIRRVLEPGGIALFATPDRSTRLLPLQRPWNRWHLREYSSTTLARALGRHFGDVEMLAMSGPRELIDVELRRYRRLKWATLPFTLPLYPDTWRVAALNRLHALRRPRAATEAPPHDDMDAGIRIGPNLAPSLNLIAIARG